MTLLGFSSRLLLATLAMGVAWQGLQLIGFKAVAGEDFIQDYVSARAWLAGDSPFHDHDELRRRFGIPAQAGTHRIEANPHLPMSILLALPLGTLPFQQAVVANRLLQLLLAGAAVAVLMTNRRWFWSAVLGFCVGAWPPFWQGLDWGQPVGFFLLLISAFWAGRDHPGVTYPTYVLMVFTKPIFFYLGAFLWWQPPRSWRGRLLLLAGGLVGLLLFPLLRDTPWDWFARSKSVAHFMGLAFAVPAVTGWNEALAKGVFVAVFLGLFAWGYRGPRPVRYLSLLILANLAFYPLTWFHHYLLLVPIFAHLAEKARERAEIYPTLAAWLLLAVPVLHGNPLAQKYCYLGSLALLAGVVARRDE